MRFFYTDVQIEFLRVGFRVHRIPALTRAFNDVFGLAKTETQIRAALKNRKIRSGRKPGFKKGERSLLFTNKQVEFIRQEYPRLPVPELAELLRTTFDLDVTKQQVRSFVKNHGIKSGRSGRFEKGCVPLNKGTAGMGICKGNSGCFDKGHIPANIKPLGSERICKKDGYVLVKIAEKNPFTGAATRYKAKHLVVWEEHNGPVPDDMVIRFLDGDPKNCAIENLVMLSRAEHIELTRCGYGDTPDALRPVVLNIARLQARTFALQRDVN